MAKPKVAKRGARKKASGKKKSTGAAKKTKKKAPRRAKPAPKKRAAPRAAAPRRVTTVPPVSVLREKQVRVVEESLLENRDFDSAEPLRPQGLGPEAGGQAGDLEGLSRAELASPESVEELVEEGQAFEAGIVSGVEEARDADRGEVETREVLEDDVPKEYLDRD